MLRILEMRGNDNSKILRLDGRLVTNWVEVLRSSCELAISEGGSLSLDMAGLSFSDGDGIQLLLQLQQRQVTFMNCSPFLREQLKQPISSDASILPQGK